MRNSCILRVNRIFDGNFDAVTTRQFQCNAGGDIQTMNRVQTEVAWRFGAGVDCDESERIVPASFLGARGITILRHDGFAHFTGRMTLTDLSDPGAPVLRFVGRLHLIGRIGSHQSLGEACDQPEHFEGWLAANGRGHLTGYRLRCIVAGQGELPGGASTIASLNRISGTLFLPA